jgi:hypothetical protein
VSGADGHDAPHRFTMMRYDATRPLKDRRPTVPGLHDLVEGEAQRAHSLARSLIAKRQDKPWLSLVAVPLALTAATVSLQLWMTPPLLALCWYWGSKDGDLAWLLGITEACFSVVWAFLGAYMLAALPQDRLLVGLLWIAYAGIVAVPGGINRWRFNRKYGW